MRNTNIPDPYIGLKNSSKILTAPKVIQYDHIGLQKLFNIICGESSKSYLNKNVDDLNKFGVFFNYKKIAALISELVLKQSPVKVLSVLPYPTSDELTAEFSREESAEVQFELYNMVGSRIFFAPKEN